MQLELKLAYYDDAVEHVSRNAMSPPPISAMKELFNHISLIFFYSFPILSSQQYTRHHGIKLITSLNKDRFGINLPMKVDMPLNARSQNQTIAKMLISYDCFSGWNQFHSQILFYFLKIYLVVSSPQPLPKNTLNLRDYQHICILPRMKLRMFVLVFAVGMRWIPCAV